MKTHALVLVVLAGCSSATPAPRPDAARPDAGATIDGGSGDAGAADAGGGELDMGTDVGADMGTPDAWAPACDIYAQTGCSAAQSCRPRGAYEAACTDTGSRTRFQTCSSDTSCARGLFCGAGTCLQPCDVDHPCPTGDGHTWRCVPNDQACYDWNTSHGFCLITDPGFMFPTVTCPGGCVC